MNTIPSSYWRDLAETKGMPLDLVAAYLQIANLLDKIEDLEMFHQEMCKQYYDSQHLGNLVMDRDSHEEWKAFRDLLWRLPEVDRS